MVFKFLGAAASTAFLLTGVPASAVTLVLDNFSSEQWVQDGPTMDNPNASELAVGGILGGARDLAVTNSKADGNKTATSEMRVTGENLKFSNVAGARGTGWLTYDGVDGDGVAVNTTGLGGVNLNIGLNPYFYFAAPANITFDHVAEFSVTAWDMTGKTVSYSELLAPGYDPNLYFSQFTGDAGFDFGNLGALQFMISSTDTADSVDGAITQIEVRASVVPLPATALLLLGGVGGLAVLRRRKQA